MGSLSIFKLTRACQEWLLTGAVTQLVLAIISKDSRIPLERWVFDIKLVEPPPDSSEPAAAKPESEIQSEIRAILKQIISMVTYLPVFQVTISHCLAHLLTASRSQLCSIYWHTRRNLQTFLLVNGWTPIHWQSKQARANR